MKIKKGDRVVIVGSPDYRRIRYDCTATSPNEVENCVHYEPVTSQFSKCKYRTLDADGDIFECICHAGK